MGGGSLVVVILVWVTTMCFRDGYLLAAIKIRWLHGKSKFVSSYAHRCEKMYAVLQSFYVEETVVDLTVLDLNSIEMTSTNVSRNPFV